MKKFTLLELLIVVAIIAILVSILLPSLSNARLKTKRAVCLSNLKQLSIAQTSFSIDNNGKFAVSSKGTNWSGHSSVSLHVWSKDVFDPFKEKYLNGNVEVFMCPVQDAEETWWEYTNKADGRISSYISATSENLSPSTSAGMSASIWQKDGENYNIQMLSKVENTGQILFADLIRYNPNHGRWDLSDNNYKNGNPEGGSEIQVDGSARWRTFQEKQLNYKHGSFTYYWRDPR